MRDCSRTTYVVLSRFTQQWMRMPQLIRSFSLTLSGSRLSMERTRARMRLRARAAFNFVLQSRMAFSIAIRFWSSSSPGSGHRCWKRRFWKSHSMTTTTPASSRNCNARHTNGLIGVSLNVLSVAGFLAYSWHCDRQIYIPFTQDIILNNAMQLNVFLLYM